MKPIKELIDALFKIAASVLRLGALFLMAVSVGAGTTDALVRAVFIGVFVLLLIVPYPE